MADTNNDFDLPRWQTHLDTTPAAPLPQTAVYPGAPPQRTHPVLTRQPRGTADPDLNPSPPFLASLSRSASLTGHPATSPAAPRIRRHPPHDDAMPSNSFYPPAVSYQPPSNAPAPASVADSFSDMYYSPKRSQDASRAGRSPLRGPSTPLHDPYQQSYPRLNSQPKSDSPAYYPIDSTIPHPASQSQTHLTTHAMLKQNSLSNPPTPISYLHSTQASHYYPHDHSMVVDMPPQRRRVSGFRRVRGVHDLQPRLDLEPAGRRMASSGSYLSVTLYLLFCRLGSFISHSPSTN
jgi:dual specificity protein kinase YAK1